MYTSKTSINNKIQKIWKLPLRIFPLNGQIQGDVVLGTTPRYPLLSSPRYITTSMICIFS